VPDFLQGRDRDTLHFGEVAQLVDALGNGGDEYSDPARHTRYHGPDLQHFVTKPCRLLFELVDLRRIDLEPESDEEFLQRLC